MGRLEIDDPFGQKATMYYVPCGPVHELDWRSSPFAGLRRLDSDKKYDPIAQQLKHTFMILDERKSVVAIGFVHQSGLVRIDKVGARDGARVGLKRTGPRL